MPETVGGMWGYIQGLLEASVDRREKVLATGKPLKAAASHLTTKHSQDPTPAHTLLCSNLLVPSPLVTSFLGEGTSALVL